MKLMIVIAVFLQSSLAFAVVRPAGKNEVKLLCDAVGEFFVEQRADIAVNTELCEKSSMVAKMAKNGVRVIGRIPTFGDFAHGYVACSLLYLGSPVKENIVKGTPYDIYCE